MTWASIARKAVAPDLVVPKQVLTVQKSEQGYQSKKSDTFLLETFRILPPEGLEPRDKAVVLDTGAFLRAHNLETLGTIFFTIQDVLNEVRDVQHREALDKLAIDVQVVTPNDDALRAVLTLTTETGDIGALSRTDLRVLAVAYQIAKEANALKVVKDIVDEQKEDVEGEEEEDVENAINQEFTKTCEHTCSDIESAPVVDTHEEVKEGDAEGEEDNWITPENIRVHQAQCGHDKIVNLRNNEEDQALVSCLTLDFSMQNALLHLGIPVLSVDGRAVQRLRTWILRCHACFTLVQDTSKQFCPACGSGNTLRKVSYTVDADGNRHVWINWRRRLNTRGIRYNLPRPRWGPQGTNRTLVLREDQLRDFGKSKSQRQILEARERALKASDGDLFAKRKNIGSHAPRERSSYHHFNVNERRQIRASRKK